MRKKFLVLIFVLVFLLIILGVVLFVFFYSSKTIVPVRQINFSEINKNEVGEEQVVYMLSELDVNELHNVPLTKNNPKIKLIVGDETYGIEVIGNSFKIADAIGDPDIRIYMSEEDFINALNSDLKLYIQNSVAEGNTKVELVASKLELAAKGYLSLYEELNG